MGRKLLLTSFVVFVTILFTFMMNTPNEPKIVTAQGGPGPGECEGYDGGVKFDPPVSTTYMIDGRYPLNVTVDIEAGTVSFTSPEFGIDKLVVKGGNLGQNDYYFDEATSGSGVTPNNPNGSPADVSHFTLCWDYELSGAKSAQPEYSIEYDWTIDKDVTPTTFSMFLGENNSASYSVNVTRSATSFDWKVTGTIDIHNNAPYSVDAWINDTLNGATVLLGCTQPLAVPAQGTASCSYVATFATEPAQIGTNEVMVTAATLDGFSASAAYDFASATIHTVGYSEVTVDDNVQGSLGSAGAGTTSFDYARIYSCSSNPADYSNGYYSYTVDNQASINETGQYDDASVAVNCYAPVVTKSANATYDERHEWNVEKVVTPTPQDIFVGNTAGYTWEVIVTEEVYNENYQVEGTIWVQNPAPMEMVVNLADVLDDGTSATITGCVNASFTGDVLTIPAGNTAECTYVAQPMDDSATLNTATATLNGVMFSGTAMVSYVANVLNDSVLVVDDEIGLNETLFDGAIFTGNDSYTCSLDSTDYEGDGTYQYTDDNLVTITYGDTTKSDTATEVINCYAPVVTKSANATYDERHEWNVEKMVTPTPQDILVGNTTGYTWEVTVTEEVYNENYQVEGTIRVQNPAPMEMVVSLADVLDDGTSATITGCVHASFTGDVLTIPAGNTAECTYVARPMDDSATLNTATAILNGVMFSGTATVSYVANVLNDSVLVVDDEIGLNETLFDGAIFTGNDSYTCSLDSANYEGDGTYQYTDDNLVTITYGDTTKSDTATEVINCYAPVVTKSANTGYKTQYFWDISKTASHDYLLLAIGQVFSGVEYDVTVWVTHEETLDIFVEGDITVTNPHPTEMMVVNVEDLLPGYTVTLDCGNTLEVPANGSASCHYYADLTDLTELTNTATVSFNSYSATTTAQVTFGAPDDLIDECVTVTDTNIPGILGTACVDTAPVTFTYTLDFGPFTADECGDQTFVNVAQLTTNDTGTIDTDDWTIVVEIACDYGCTLTPGYWKTHSSYGPAPYDDTWALIGEDAPFFLSGQTYYQVLWTSPGGGNAYYILARAYIAAQLNALNGATVPAEVDTAMQEANTLFSLYTPVQVANMRGASGKELRMKFINLALTLDNYNNGLIGPGHCSEDVTSGQ